MENNEALQNDQVTSIITGVDNIISAFKEVIMWGEKMEPGLLPKELYDAFYEFVAFNLGTKQPFLDKISEYLGSKHDVLLSDILQNKKFAGQLTIKDAFDYLRNIDDTRGLLTAIYSEFTSKEYDDLVEILDSPIYHDDQRQVVYQKFQNIFEKTDHSNFLRALWMHRWILTGITENSFLYEHEQYETWHWRHFPMFHPSINKDYLEFQIFHAVFGCVYEGFIPTPLFRQSRAERLFIPEYDQYDCKKTYYWGWRDRIKKLGDKLVSKINDLSALYRYGDDLSFHCEDICTELLISGLINNLRNNGCSINTAGKFNQEWFSRWSQQFIEDYDMSKDESDSLTNYTITEYAVLDDCAIDIMKNFYSNDHNEHIQIMGEAILLYSKLMFDVYNLVKDLLREEQKQELLQMLKRCYYTNCLLPYYVEPETTEENNQLTDSSVLPGSSYMDIFNFFDNNSIYSKKTVKTGNYTLNAKQLFANYSDMFIKESPKIGNQLDVYAFMYMWMMSELFNVTAIINLVLPEVFRKLLNYSSFYDNDEWRNLIKQYTTRAEGVRTKLEKRGENARLAWKDICGIVPIVYEVIFGGSFSSMRKHRGRKSIGEDVQPPYESITIRRIYAVFYFEKEYKERYEGTIDNHNVSFPMFLRDYYSPGYFLRPAEYYYKAYKDDRDESKKSLAVQLYNMIKQEQLYKR